MLCEQETLLCGENQMAQGDVPLRRKETQISARRQTSIKVQYEGQGRKKTTNKYLQRKCVMKARKYAMGNRARGKAA